MSLARQLTQLQSNNDQAFRVLAAIAAAEYRFQSPPPPYVCWQELCINAFNFYARRWNTSTCGGGLQWQSHLENAGFYYKNAVSNGAFF
jgi:mannan endo-1,6-alpha-mannosidase